VCLCAFRTRVHTRKPAYPSALPQTPTPPYASAASPHASHASAPRPHGLMRLGTASSVCVSKAQSLKFSSSSSPVSKPFLPKLFLPPPTTHHANFHLHHLSVPEWRSFEDFTCTRRSLEKVSTTTCDGATGKHQTGPAPEKHASPTHAGMLSSRPSSTEFISTRRALPRADSLLADEGYECRDHGVTHGGGGLGALPAGGGVGGGWENGELGEDQGGWPRRWCSFSGVSHSVTRE